MRKFTIILLLVLMVTGPAFGKIKPQSCWRKSLGGNFSLPYAGTSTMRDAVPSGVWVWRAGDIWYDITGDDLYIYDSGGSWAIHAAGGGTTLDGAYDYGSAANGAKINASDGTVEIEVADNSGNSALLLDQNDATQNSVGLSVTNAGTGNGIDLQAAQAGNDIQGTDDTWAITTAGTFDGELFSGVTNSNFMNFAGNNEVEFGDNSEDISLNFATGDTLTFTSDTDVVNVAWGTLDAHTFDGATASTITQTGTGAADDLTISQAASGVDASLILQSSGTGTDALSLISSVADIDLTSADNIDINAADNIELDTDGGTIDMTSAGGDISLDATDKSVNIDGGEAAANAVVIDASNAGGGIDMDCGTAGFNLTVTAGDLTLTNTTAKDIILDAQAGRVLITGTESDADAIALVADGAAGEISLSAGTGDIDIDSTDDVTINAADDITIDTVDGGVSLVADGPANGDITLDSEDDLILTSTGKVTITNTEAVTISGNADIDGVLTTDGVNMSVIVPPDGAAYDVLAANTGIPHMIIGQTADITMDLPTEAAGLYFKFVYVGGAEDAQDWIIDSENNTNFFIGGLATVDDDDGDCVIIYSDGSDDSIIKIDTPNAGTVVEIWCDGTNWYLSGTVYSGTDTAVAFSNL